MFLNLEKHPSSSIAAIDDAGTEISYGELIEFSNRFLTINNKRTLIFILSENSIGSLAAYVACLNNRIVPVLLSRNTDMDSILKLVNLYSPSFLWIPEASVPNFKYREIFNEYGYSLVSTGSESYSLHNDLSLLLPTSGSTGSPKMVRHNYKNIEQNAQNVASFFEIDKEHKPIIFLPMHYTMGLSVISSHLFAGSTLILTGKKLTDKSFWSDVKNFRATSFTGVPFSFEVLYKLRFFNMDLPHLNLLSQGGGKLSPEIFKAFAEYAVNTGKKFIATYGQTEATARMAYLPAEMAIHKTCSIGKAIPNGRLDLVDENGQLINDSVATGELVYTGPNVTMGYASNKQDLLKGDENKGFLFTGDIAQRDSEGFYYIMGRKSRFLKLYGIRISLDETENLIKSVFKTDCVCSGNDNQMLITVINNVSAEAVKSYVVEKTGLFHQGFQVETVSEITKTEIGKTLYVNK